MLTATDRRAVTIASWPEGNKMITRASWRTESAPGSGDYDTLTDPTAVVFTARRRRPDGRFDPATDYEFGVDAEVTRVSVGVYEFAHVPAPGRWHIHAQGTGAAQGAERDTYEIDHSEALAA